MYVFVTLHMYYKCQVPVLGVNDNHVVALEKFSKGGAISINI